jgi:hypothetical protein
MSSSLISLLCSSAAAAALSQSVRAPTRFAPARRSAMQ